MRISRSIIFAVVTATIVGAIFAQGIYSSAIQDPYLPLEEKAINLTKAGHVWDQHFLRDGELMRRTQSVLPLNKFGHNLINADEIVYQTGVQLSPSVAPPHDLALHFLRIFSREFSVAINGVVVATHRDYDHAANFVIPRNLIGDDGSLLITVTIDPSGIAEPGFDLRANILIGPKEDLDRLSNRILRRDHALVLWLLLPALVIAMLFSLGSIIFSFSREYQYFAAFCLLSGLATAAMYGRLPFASQLFDAPSLRNSLHLMSLASLSMFLMYFFRRFDKWLCRASAFVAFIALGQYLVSQTLGAPSTLFFLCFKLALLLQVAVICYGLFAASSAFIQLNRTKKSKPRLVISGVLSVVFLVAMPVYLLWFTYAGPFWLTGPLFELSFMAILAGCVSVDIGGVRADRDLIRQKLGVFTDETKVSYILNNQVEGRFLVRDVSAMMIDVRSFCSLNEVYSRAEVFEAMSEYYNLVITCVYRCGGVVDKFMGDGILAIWGMGENDTPEHVLACMSAAITLRKELRELSVKRESQGKFPLCVGTGIHSGEVSIGILGNHNRAEFTVVGSAINIAARIEKATKDFDSDILVSEKTLEKVVTQVVACHRGTVTIAPGLKGQSVYHLLGVVSERMLITNEPLFDKFTSKIVEGCVLPTAPRNLNVPDYSGKATAPKAKCLVS